MNRSKLVPGLLLLLAACGGASSAPQSVPQPPPAPASSLRPAVEAADGEAFRAHPPAPGPDRKYALPTIEEDASRMA